MKLRFLPLLLLPGLLAGCTDTSTNPVLEQKAFNALGGLARGEAIAVSGAAASQIFLAGGADGESYLYVPFLAADNADVTVDVTVRGENLAGGATLDLGPVRPTLPSGVSDLSPRAEAVHQERMQTARRLLGPRLASARAAARDGAARSNRVVRDVVPANPGALVTLNVPDFTTGDPCSNYTVHTGRVVAVSSAAIVVADDASPLGGYTQADYQSFADRFASLVDPVDTRAFGSPREIGDVGIQHDRIVIFFTHAVNEETPPDADFIVGGYFWAGDLFPSTGEGACAQSNEAEMFYLPVPEAGTAYDYDFVKSLAIATLGHEYQHLINAVRRIYVNDATSFEEVWLNEGLSHIAEELLFYAASGLHSGQNIDVDKLRSSEQIVDAFNEFQIQNILRYESYLEQPDNESLLGVDNLRTRGAIWAFLRYADDLAAEGDTQFFYKLVNSRTAGVANLNTVLATSAIDLMQHWTVSVYTDDYVQGIADIYEQPSWDYRSIESFFFDDFPLKVHHLGASGSVAVTLQGGGASFILLNTKPHSSAIVHATTSGATGSGTLRVSVVRTQ